MAISKRVVPGCVPTEVKANSTIKYGSSKFCAFKRTDPKSSGRRNPIQDVDMETNARRVASKKPSANGILFGPVGEGKDLVANSPPQGGIGDFRATNAGKRNR